MEKCRSEAPKRPPKRSQKWSRDMLFSILANPWFRATLQGFCLIFMVLGYPGAAKKRSKNASEKKAAKKSDRNRFFTKKCENGAQNGLRFGSRILPRFPPEGSLFRLGAQGDQKGAQGHQKRARGRQKTSKGTPKDTKKALKWSQKGMKIITKIIKIKIQIVLTVWCFLLVVCLKLFQFI